MSADLGSLISSVPSYILLLSDLSLNNEVIIFPVLRSLKREAIRSFKNI